MKTSNAHGAAFGILVAVLLGVGLYGCNVDPRWSTRFGTRDSLTGHGGKGAVDITAADEHEVDLVEAVAASRNAYHKNLKALFDYYSRNGYDAKRSWAAMELNGLRAVKKFGYLLDAEVPSGRLAAKDSIPEADKLYKQGVALMRRGGHGIPGIFRQDRMIEAAEVFRQMIHDYPTSDKIDDAAFLCGEIHKEYLEGQEPIAVKWYERAWTWDPHTPHPAKFNAAVTYDYRLHDRDRALELYHEVANDPDSTPANARFAVRRIEELTKGAASTASLRR